MKGSIAIAMATGFLPRCVGPVAILVGGGGGGGGPGPPYNAYSEPRYVLGPSCWFS